MEKAFEVLFLPAQRQGAVEPGTSLQEAASCLGVEIESACGGRGVCGKCRVRVAVNRSLAHGGSADLEPVTPPEEDERLLTRRLGFRPDERMACRARVQGHVLVFVPEESRRARWAVCKGVRTRTPAIVPSIRKRYVEVPPADGDRPRSEADRLVDELRARFSLPDLCLDLAVLQTLAAALEEDGGRVTATVWQER